MVIIISFLFVNDASLIVASLKISSPTRIDSSRQPVKTLV
jgi:hypothetical protein